MHIGDRLREERERIGLNQTAFAAVGGVKKLSQINYEAGTSFPNAQYLSEVSKVGVDIQYVVTGIRAISVVNEEELNLLKAYRAASPSVKAFMQQGVQQVEPKIKAKSGGQVAIGSGNIQIGGKSGEK